MTFRILRDGKEVARFRAAKIVRQRWTLTAFSADGKLIGSFFTTSTKDLSIEQVEEPKNATYGDPVENKSTEASTAPKRDPHE